jgi:hypothetical protein
MFSVPRVARASQVVRHAILPAEEMHKTVPHLSYPLTAAQINQQEIHIFKDDPSLEHFKTVEAPISDEKSDQVGFRLSRLPGFITSSCDSKLLEQAMVGIKGAPKVKLIASTSSSTGILSQFYFVLSNFARININSFSKAFATEPSRFTARTFLPTVVMMRKRNLPNGQHVWACDSISSDPSPGSVNALLSKLGHVLEKKLTMSREEYENTYLYKNVKEKKEEKPENYYVSQYGRLLFRSQLDSCHFGIKGSSKVFDLKTRASAQIRYGHVQDGEPIIPFKFMYGKNMGSFEKEVYDLTRSAFLKYYFQASLGNMAGILAAYHNTEKLFALDFFSKERLAQYICGSPEFLQNVYHCSLTIFDRAMEYILNDVQNQANDLLFSFRSSPNSPYQMEILVEMLAYRSVCSLVPLEELCEKYESKAENVTQRDELVSSEDRTRVSESVIFICFLKNLISEISLKISSVTPADLIRSATNGKIRKYKLRLLPLSSPGMDSRTSFSGECEFEVVREFSSPSVLAEEMFRALQDGKYLIEESD